jgi:hypothetical protein
MPWVRFDDQYPLHRKVAPLNHQAFRLCTEAVFWCLRNLTDGRIGPNEVDTIAPKVKGKGSAIVELVRHGLWHVPGHDCPRCAQPVEGGWVVHDIGDYQPSAEKVAAERKAKAERQQRWQERRKVRRPKDASYDGLKDGSDDGPEDDAPSPPPSPPRREAGTGGPRAVKPASRSKAEACAHCGNSTGSAYHRKVCAPAISTDRT